VGALVTLSSDARELIAAFNSAIDKTRVLMLVSPT
jgi:hypothetical protein